MVVINKSIMKASVQYNDLIGTCAADVSDFYSNHLQNYLTRHFTNYDENIYLCVGCKIWISDRNEVNIHFICRNKNTNEYIQMGTIEWWSLEKVFDLFKRTEIVFGRKYEHIENIEVDENNSIELIEREF